LKYCLISTFIIVTVIALNLTSINTNQYNQLNSFVESILINGFPLLSFTYLLSFMFSSTGNSMLFILIVYTTISSVCFFAYSILDLQPIRESTDNAIDYFWFFFTILPNFNFELAVHEITISGVTTTFTTDSDGNTVITQGFQWANDACLKWNMINLGYGFA